MTTARALYAAGCLLASLLMVTWAGAGLRFALPLAALAAPWVTVAVRDRNQTTRRR